MKTNNTLISIPKNISLLIPTYNAANDLVKLLPSLLNQVPVNRICIFDDGSEDDTEIICKKYKLDYQRNTINQGKGAALKNGFNYLLKKRNIDWILTMDADGQHAIDDISNFIRATKKYPGSGIIIGSRDKKLSAMPIERIFSNSTTSLLLSFITKRRILDSQCGYRIYSSSLIKAITIQYSRFEMETEVILKACFLGFPIHFIPVQTLYCSTNSHISHFKDTIRWVKAVLKLWFQLKRSR